MKILLYIWLVEIIIAAIYDVYCQLDESELYRNGK